MLPLHPLPLSSLISCVVDCCIFFFVIVVVVIVVVMSSPLLPNLLSRSPLTFSGWLLFCIYRWPPLVVMAALALIFFLVGGDGSIVVIVVSPPTLRRRRPPLPHVIVVTGTFWPYPDAPHHSLTCWATVYIVLKQYWIVNDDENEEGHAVHSAWWRELLRAMSYVAQFWPTRLGRPTKTT